MNFFMVDKCCTYRIFIVLYPRAVVSYIPDYSIRCCYFVMLTHLETWFLGCMAT